MGTNNETLLNDPYYVGLRRRRVTGAVYDELIDEFVTAATEVFPGVIIQFEDFANHNAFRLLEAYRDKVCTFNDDIQGTASVALAGLFSAARAKNGTLADDTFLFLGAGEAATGIAELITAALVEGGMAVDEARGRSWLFDSKGLVVKSRAGLAPQKLAFAHDHAPVGDFLTAVQTLKPSAIIGVAAVGGSFTPEVLAAMAAINPRPIIFALSNPTSKAECTAEQAYAGTEGRALFACGSPFAPVHFGGRTLVPRQGNNCYIFPGVGLGAIACGATRITNDMFLAAARCLAAQVTPADLDQGSLYPPLSQSRTVAAAIAATIAEVAFDAGLASRSRPEDLAELVAAHMYDPHYPVYV
jgi:malate dehydrogenase (oxaloacetate-decarboxylating)(NADP+)